MYLYLFLFSRARLKQICGKQMVSMVSYFVNAVYKYLSLENFVKLDLKRKKVREKENMIKEDKEMMSKKCYSSVKKGWKIFVLF